MNHAPSLLSIAASLRGAFLLVAHLLVLGGLAVPAFAVGGATISPDEVHRGMKGYGLTAMVGSEPERFEVEVIGVLRGERPGSSSILVRLSGLDLEESGVIAGMSGSPVYFDDRLAGAVAFGWQFSQQPLAGVTPIGAMEELIAVDRSASSAEALGGVAEVPRSSPVSMPTLQQFLRRESLELVSGDLLRQHLSALVAPAPLRDARGALAWGARGFGAQGQAVLDAGLGSVSELGRAARTTAAEPADGIADGAALDPSQANLGPGSPVAAVLVGGDLNLSAAGTVTDRRDDVVLAMGHPFLALGAYRLPMAEAEIVAVIPSLNNSFKLSNVGAVVGSFREDRTPGLLGRVGERPRTIPLNVRIGGAGTVSGLDDVAEYQMVVADLPVMIPTLLAVATLGVLDVDAHSAGPQTLEMTTHMELAEWGPITLRQVFDGPNAGNELASYLLIFTNLLVQSPLAQVQLDSVAVDVRRLPADQTLDLVDVHADRSVVVPGAWVRLFVDLRSRSGEGQRRELRFQVPPTAPEGTYTLLVGDGASTDSARFTLAPAAPARFEQQLELLRSLSSNQELVVLGLVQDRGLAVDGGVLPRLPGSVASLWGPKGSSGAQPLGLALDAVESELLPYPIEGLGRVDLTVRRPPTQTGGPAVDGGPASTGGGPVAGSPSAPGASGAAPGARGGTSSDAGDGPSGETSPNNGSQEP